jgi:hypothetical protein
MKTLFLVLALALNSSALAAVCSRTITFSDGSVLTAAQLNDELNTAFSCINNIDNANIATGANISASKINAAIAGDGIGRDGSTGVLEVNDDNSTLEISGDIVQVKDAGITGAKLATSAADGTHLEVASGSMRIKDSGVTTVKINDSAVTTAKINDGAVTDVKRSALNIQVSSDSGTFATSSASFSDVTSLSVSITTIGRPVFLGVVPGSTNDGGPGSTANIANVCIIEYNRGGTEISRSYLAGHSVLSAHYIDQPSSGTYTYKIRARTISPSSCNVTRMKLVAYEL